MKEIEWVLLTIKNLMKEIIWEKEKKIINNQKNQKLIKDTRWKIQNLLKGLIAKKTEIMMILLIFILSWIQMW